MRRRMFVPSVSDNVLESRVFLSGDVIPVAASVATPPDDWPPDPNGPYTGTSWGPDEPPDWSHDPNDPYNGTSWGPPSYPYNPPPPPTFS